MSALARAKLFETAWELSAVTRRTHQQSMVRRCQSTVSHHNTNSTVLSCNRSPKMVMRTDRPNIILGVETSCDDTALALIDTNGRVLSHATKSQWQLFDRFKGVQPMLAAEAHQEAIEGVFQQLLSQSSLSSDSIDGVAVTSGPGMAPCLQVGMAWASIFAAARQLPYIGVHHILAHAMVAEMEEPLQRPFLALLISGGHTELWLVEDSGITILAHTVDDAIGEAFDKAARIIGIPRGSVSPGAAVEALAKQPIKQRHSFPDLDPKNLDFSFSGLKSSLQRKVFDMRLKRAQEQADASGTNDSTELPSKLSNEVISQLVREHKADLFRDSEDAVERKESEHAFKLPPLEQQDQIDLCASFQHALLRQLETRVLIALQFLRSTRPSLQLRQLVVGGGVACNLAVQSALTSTVAPFGLKVITPRRLHCMDNGIMIAHLGSRLLQQGHSDTYDLRFHTRWPIGEKIQMTRTQEKPNDKRGKPATKTSHTRSLLKQPQQQQQQHQQQTVGSRWA